MSYGTIACDTLNTSTGVLASQNGITGIAKAWVNYNATTQTINGSFNVSSVTYNSTGNFTVNFTTAMPNANYAVCANAGDTSSGYSTIYTSISSLSTSGFYIKSANSANTVTNYNYTCASVFSS